MPCCRNRSDSGFWRALLLAGVLLLVSPASWAGSIRATTAQLTSNESSYVLTADFAIDLGAALENIILRGVPLYFQLEIEITRDRWFWPNQHIAGRVLNYRLTYNPLVRRYRLTTAGGLSQDFSDLTAALRLMGRTVALPVAERQQLKTGIPYQVALRLTLDRQQLPKPLQLDALANKDWTLETEVLRWQFIPTPPSASAMPASPSAPPGVPAPVAVPIAPIAPTAPTAPTAPGPASAPVSEMP